MDRLVLVPAPVRPPEDIRGVFPKDRKHTNDITLVMTSEEEFRKKRTHEIMDQLAKDIGFTKRQPTTDCPCCGKKFHD